MGWNMGRRHNILRKIRHWQREVWKGHGCYWNGDWASRGIANTLPSIAVPCIIVASVNAKIRWDAHWEHVAHEEHENPRAERPEYAYQNIRTKNYFWGDGDKV
jgi:hypothetical protein